MVLAKKLDDYDDAIRKDRRETVVAFARPENEKKIETALRAESKDDADEVIEVMGRIVQDVCPHIVPT